MTAHELYQAGKLTEAVDAQIQQVKANPTDQNRRLFLFELLLFTGELDRATRQVDALKYDDPGLAATAMSYRGLLNSETARRKVFEEGVAPEFLGTPPSHLVMRLEAAGQMRLGRHDQANALLNQAEEATPAFKGTLNGKPFESFRDADDLLSGVLEVMAQGKYYWVGIDQIVSIAMNPPSFPRNLIYAPARIELESETGEVFLPVLYPSTYKNSDDLIRLGRMTDWITSEGGAVFGVGTRVFLVDDDSSSVLDIREWMRDEVEEG
jgi:type VI secretion system protein ImpE